MRFHSACIVVLLLAVLSTIVRMRAADAADLKHPAGALVWVNHREVGRTPLEIDFTYYGHYDVQLTREGSEPVITTAEANPPVWDVIEARSGLRRDAVRIPERGRMALRSGTTR